MTGAATPQAARTAAPWTGTWVAERLGVRLGSGDSAVGIRLDELVGLAIRRNPRRAHLLVSTVLGKHVPTDPRIVAAAGTLLGHLATDALAGTTTVADAARAADVAGALREALAGADATDAAGRFHAAVGALAAVAPAPPADAVVIGYAETATALGHCVGRALALPSLHSTRREVAGVRPAAGFAEEHSHATDHLLLPDDPQMLARADVLVLVDDEISTGRTALNTIAALQADRPRSRYVVAALIDLRSTADRDRFGEVARELGTQIDVVALASGGIDLPADVLARAERVLAQEVPALVAPAASPATAPAPAAAPAPAPAAAPGSRGSAEPAGDRASVWRLPGWPAGVRDGGRHGFRTDDEAPLARAARAAARGVAGALVGDRVLVLGFEELMYAPLLLGVALVEETASARPGGGPVRVRYSTTTRSPVLAVDDPGYAIRTTLGFPSHDDPSDGPGPRYAHNVAAGMEASRRFTDIVVVIDSPADTGELTAPGGLLDAVAGCCDQVHLVVVPAYHPEEPTP